MTTRLKVGLLYGGQNGEHEVSLASAASVLRNLDAERYEVIPISIDKQGHMYLHHVDDLYAFTTALPVHTPNAQVVSSLIQDAKFFMPVDVVLPMLHGVFYEDGCLQGLLKLANVACVGCDVLASAIGMDKDIARRLACTDGIRCTQYQMLDALMSDNIWEQKVDDAIASYGWPLFIKPCASGSSVGIYRVESKDAAMAAIKSAFLYDEQVLIEAYAPGREIEVSVLENAQGREILTSLPGEICVHHPDGFYSYDAKYIQSDCSDYFIPAVLSAKWTQEIQRQAREIFIKLKCKGMARVDFFLNEDQNILYFNEINTLPGFTTISFYPSLWGASGIAYSKLLDVLIETAVSHQKIRAGIVTDFKF